MNELNLVAASSILQHFPLLPKVIHQPCYSIQKKQFTRFLLNPDSVSPTQQADLLQTYFEDLRTMLTTYDPALLKALVPYAFLSWQDHISIQQHPSFAWALYASLEPLQEMLCRTLNRKEQNILLTGVAQTFVHIAAQGSPPKRIALNWISDWIGLATFFPTLISKVLQHLITVAPSNNSTIYSLVGLLAALVLNPEDDLMTTNGYDRWLLFEPLDFEKKKTRPEIITDQFMEYLGWKPAKKILIRISKKNISETNFSLTLTELNSLDENSWNQRLMARFI